MAAKLPPPTDGDLTMLRRILDRTAERRLGSRIRVGDGFNGMIACVPTHQSATQV